MLLPVGALVASASPVVPQLTPIPAPMPSGWLARYLLDPAGFTSRLVHHVLDPLAHAARWITLGSVETQEIGSLHAQ